jgi:hypothetical protein
MGTWKHGEGPETMETWSLRHGAWNMEDRHGTLEHGTWNMELRKMDMEPQSNHYSSLAVMNIEHGDMEHETWNMGLWAWEHGAAGNIA